MKMVYKEFLGIYIYSNPEGEIQREYNKEALQKAEAIKSQRSLSIINQEFGFLDTHQQKEDFLEYYHTISLKKPEKWLAVYNHFAHFMKGKCTFEEVTVELCQKFREYLLTARQFGYKEGNLSRNSAAGYFSTFRALLKIAYRERRIKENINDYLDKIEYQETTREYLTLEELQKLLATPCPFPLVKNAALFSCLTGLRMSDILTLEWDHIVLAPNGKYCIRKSIIKTETQGNLPLSDEALELCGKREKGKVFKGLAKSNIYYWLPQWLKEAGIKKHITFHCFRHTFAVLHIAGGTDIFTLSKLLVHKNVATTQNYTKVIDKKKWETVGTITLKQNNPKNE